MENLFEPKFDPARVNALSNLGLAHVGDGVYELLVRTYLCAGGVCTVKNLHKKSVELVKAASQARFAQKLLPQLSEQELAFFRRGKNSHTHAAPKGATPQEYALATGLETLFGALYLLGRRERLNELFYLMME